MARYESRDLAFEIPADWEDRSVVAFSAPNRAEQSMAANVVVTQDQLPPSDSIRAYADRQLVELAKRLDEFDLTERKELTVGGLPAVELRFGWQGQGGRIEQRMIFVAKKNRSLITFTATAEKKEAARLEMVFDRIVGSLRFPDADPVRG
jgi:hypothetical protein